MTRAGSAGTLTVGVGRGGSDEVHPVTARSSASVAVAIAELARARPRTDTGPRTDIGLGIDTGPRTDIGLGIDVARPRRDIPVIESRPARQGNGIGQRSQKRIDVRACCGVPYCDAQGATRIRFAQAHSEQHM